MTPVLYDPPYDSPLEDEFARNIAKYLCESVDLRKQVEVNTICGSFFTDFVIRLGQYRVGIECDGAEFHNISRDEWRDAVILGAEEVDVMYHFPGKGLYYHLEDCLYILAKLEPVLFSERGHINLTTLATDAARGIDLAEIKNVKNIILVHYPSEQRQDPLVFSIFRRSLKDGVAFWQEAYRFAKASGIDNLDEVIQTYRNP